MWAEFTQLWNYALMANTCHSCFQGKLNTYRFCDNVWTFVLNNAEFRDSQIEVAKVDKVKIVACDGKSMILYDINCGFLFKNCIIIYYVFL